MRKWIIAIGTVLAVFAVLAIITAVCKDNIDRYIGHAIYSIIGVLLFWFCPGFTFWKLIVGKTRDAYYEIPEGWVKLYAILMVIYNGIPMLCG